METSELIPYTCLHGYEYEDGDNYPRECEQCRDLLQIRDGEEFLSRIGMKRDRT